MCLGLPGQILEMKGDTAIADFWGVKKEIRVDSTGDSLLPGDFVIVHAGAAVRRIEPEEVCDVLGMYEVILAEGGVDPILMQEI